MKQTRDSSRKALTIKIIQQVIRIHTLDNIGRIPKGAAVSVGMFDGVHLGHRTVLQSLCAFAAELGTSPLAITFDRHPRLVLSNGNNDFHLLNTNAERYKIMEDCGIGDVLEIHFTPQVAQLSACQFANEFLVKKLAVKGLLLGYDNMFGNKARNDFDKIPALAAEAGFQIRYGESIVCDGIEISSTQIRKALASGNIALANKMLGYPYRISGRVEHGRGVGHTIDFPTANIKPADPLKMLPADGVYCARAIVGGKSHDAMCNIGPQPTFGNGTRTMEVHIFDFCDDIYGQDVEVCLFEKIRDISKFSTPQELINQLHNDKQSCIASLKNITTP